MPESDTAVAVPETVRCGDAYCLERIVAINADGWGICAAGHDDSPVPEDWSPPFFRAPVDGQWVPDPLGHEFIFGFQDPEGRDRCGHGDCRAVEDVHLCPEAIEFRKEHAFDKCGRCWHIGLSHRFGFGCRYGDGNGLECDCEEWVPVQLGQADPGGPVTIEGQIAADERFNGDPVIEHRLGFSGSPAIDRYRTEYRDFWDGLRFGQKGRLTVLYSVGAQSQGWDAKSLGVVYSKKLKIGGISLPGATAQAEDMPLFKDGISRWRAPLVEFADAMELRLHDRDDASWTEMPMDAVLARIDANLASFRESNGEAIDQIADVANYAMFAWQMMRALESAPADEDDTGGLDDMLAETLTDEAE